LLPIISEALNAAEALDAAIGFALGAVVGAGLDAEGGGGASRGAAAGARQPTRSDTIPKKDERNGISREDNTGEECPSNVTPAHGGQAERRELAHARTA
jgi:hypothetical protein